MEIFKVKACSPPSCGCPTLTVEDIEGERRVVVTDDYNGMVVMTQDEFEKLAVEFLNQTGIYQVRSYVS